MPTSQSKAVRKREEELKKLQDILAYKRKNAWEVFSSKEDRKAVFDFAEMYKQFMNIAKTERESVSYAETILESEGFTRISMDTMTESLSATQRDKIYFSYEGRVLGVFVRGKEPLERGVNFILSHIDSPRLDLKPHPIYEEEHLLFFKTHYYGGIKKYQWTALPLALHGVVVLRDGKSITLRLGEESDEPVFMITDLLPHLARKQMSKSMKEGIEAEDLNVVIGTIPIESETIKEKVKLAILEYLHNEYGFVEEDFVSAEITLVPAGKARDVGFDRGLIAAYGHDDRSSSFAGLRALLDTKEPTRSALLVWIDREEVGSEGKTGAQGAFLEIFLRKICSLFIKGFSSQSLQEIFSRSSAISADVDVIFDPTYKSVFESNNTPRINHGVVLIKYTGHGGKYDSSEASAEYTAKIRKIFHDNAVPWQTGELGRVDEGGGGTIAKYIANKGINIVDCGPGLLSMHAPWELVSKADLYSTYLAYKAFYECMK